MLLLMLLLLLLLLLLLRLGLVVFLGLMLLLNDCCGNGGAIPTGVRTISRRLLPNISSFLSLTSTSSSCC
jgi:hypothetical protein